MLAKYRHHAMLWGRILLLHHKAQAHALVQGSE